MVCSDANSVQATYCQHCARRAAVSSQQPAVREQPAANGPSSTPLPKGAWPHPRPTATCKGVGAAKRGAGQNGPHPMPMPDKQMTAARTTQPTLLALLTYLLLGGGARADLDGHVDRLHPAPWGGECQKARQGEKGRATPNRLAARKAARLGQGRPRPQLRRSEARTGTPGCNWGRKQARTQGAGDWPVHRRRAPTGQGGPTSRTGPAAMPCARPHHRP